MWALTVTNQNKNLFRNLLVYKVETKAENLYILSQTWSSNIAYANQGLVYSLLFTTAYGSVPTKMGVIAQGFHAQSGLRIHSGFLYCLLKF